MTLSSTLAGGAGTRLTKTGAGTLTVTGISGGTAASPTMAPSRGGTYSGATEVFESVVSMPFANSFGSAPGTAAIQFLLDASTLNGLLNVNVGGVVALSSGMLTASGGVVNNGTVRLAHGAKLAVGGPGAAADAGEGCRPRGGVGGATFINIGTLDIITGDFVAPAGFTNNGVVIDSRVVQVKNVIRSGGAVMIDIDGYGGHIYLLQRSESLSGDSFANVGSTQGGAGAILTFQDASPSPKQGFYRVQVDP